MPLSSWLNKYSLRRSITLASTFITVCALFIANLFFLGYVYVQARQNLSADIASLGKLLADRSTAAVIFDDPAVAEEILSSVKSKRHILLACTYDDKGKIVAKLPTPEHAQPCPPASDKAEHHFADGTLDHFEPIMQRETRIGSVFVRAGLEDLDALWRSYLLLAAAVALITSVLAYFLANRVLAVLAEPLTQLTHTAQQIAHRSREERMITESERIDWNHTGELGSLVNAFNEMLDQIAERDRVLREANDTLEERVRQRTEALNDSNRQLQAAAVDLRQAKEVAEAANVAKSNFLARMSHELRTPLNAILGFSQLMARDPETSPGQRDQLGIINRSGEHLLAMINDVLDLSKIEAGRMDLVLDSFDLHHLCTEVAELMRIRATEKGLTLHVSVAPEVPSAIRSDAGKLRQVLINLLGNAVKFTQHGSVHLELSCPKTTTLRIEVRDTGIGIPAELQGGVFDPFVQANAHVKGTGLGLAISRRFVEMLGGQIGLDSVPGEGTRFWLEIPAEWVEIDFRPSAVSRGRVTGLAAGQPVWRVLAAEDDPASQTFIAKLLGQIGFDLRIAANGEEAVYAFRQWKPDLILMDIRMPVLDGLQATRLIRTLPGGDLPIVALTASVFREEQPEILRAGCSDVLFKPLQVDELFAVIAKQIPVEYRYEQSREVVPPKDDDALRAESGRLPQEIRVRLLDAARRLDGDSIEAERLALAAAHPALAKEIGLCLQRFDYAAIAELLAANNGDNDV